MKLPNLSEMFTSVKTFEQKNRAEILTFCSVVGLWTAIVTTYKAAPRAQEILRIRGEDFRDTDPKDHKTKRTIALETIRDLTPVIAPPIIAGAVTTGCIIGSNSVQRNRLATLSAAYTFADARLRDYKTKMNETLGDSKAQRVREAISKEHLKNNPLTEKTAIIATGLGDQLCFDEYTAKYFYCSAEAIGQAMLKLSYRLQSEMWIDLNEFYDEIRLPMCKMGNDLGWSIDDSDKGRIPVYYTAILDDYNRPCLCVQFDVSIRERNR